MARTQENRSPSTTNPVDEIHGWVKSQWNHLARWLHDDLDALAREHKAAAFQAHARIKDASTLTHLVCLWAVGSFSLQACAAFAHAAGLVSMSSVALQRRFVRMQGYLEALLVHLMPDAEEGPALNLLRKWQVLIVDATHVASKAGTCRLHWAMRLADLAIAQIVYDPDRPRLGETFRNFNVRAGQLLIGDRGYCSAVGLLYLHQAKAHGLVRYSRNLALYADAEKKQRLDPLKLARKARTNQVYESVVWIVSKHGHALQVRIIVKKLSTAARQRQREQLKRSKVQSTPYSLTLAGYLILITTLPGAELSVDEALALYRMRWQIELRFRRAKSLMKLNEVRARTSKSVTVWLLAHLVMQLVLDKSEAEALPDEARREQAYRIDQMAWQMLQSALFSIPLKHLAVFLKRFSAALPTRQSARKRRAFHRLDLALAPRGTPIWEHRAKTYETLVQETS
jgi:hypothetical protein